MHLCHTGRVRQGPARSSGVCREKQQSSNMAEGRSEGASGTARRARLPAGRGYLVPRRRTAARTRSGQPQAAAARALCRPSSHRRRLVERRRHRIRDAHLHPLFRERRRRSLHDRGSAGPASGTARRACAGGGLGPRMPRHFVCDVAAIAAAGVWRCRLVCRRSGWPGRLCGRRHDRSAELAPGPSRRRCHRAGARLRAAGNIWPSLVASISMRAFGGRND